MVVSDWINVVLCVLSFLLAAVSVITVVITLRQNHRMIENATRPHIVVAYDIMTVSDKATSRYIVIKNYGNSSAIITEMHCTGISDKRFLKQLGRIVNTTLAPSQRRLYYLDAQESVDESATFSYSYASNKKTYSDTTTIPLSTGAMVQRPNSPSTIAFALQEIAERHI